jgi:hypothetical protein
MNGINYPRVWLGGLAAGVVANIGDMITGVFLLAEDMQRMVQRLSLNPQVMQDTRVMTTWIVVDFIYATLIVWTYAAIRPRLGPGPTTAVVAALVIWGAVTLILFGFQTMGVFTMDLFVKSAVTSAVVAALAGVTGAALYRERSA